MSPESKNKSLYREARHRLERKTHREGPDRVTFYIGRYPFGSSGKCQVGEVEREGFCKQTLSIGLYNIGENIP